ncbi:hypothetical protein V1502_13275 [Bacillus sp. SCS-153A]|uniref:hypothetical protein n=1 Tax=Rossellomorea sedimentorum TaxID=3115294 RepID=UPI00390658DD
MTWFFVILIAVVYGFIMKYVLNNVFVSNCKGASKVNKITEAKEARDLLPAYDR